MQLTKVWGMIALAVWLIVTGLMAIIPALDVIPAIVMGILAILAGVLILINK